ncbi:Acyl-CoA dehydrogenase/oxidase domain protein [Pseudomonas synxantha]|uniref:Acyl-CoA dehydrogenase/oxidase domain protein n=1 Tax=Pseudomonas synxantha TaxID=47883 RepID=A0A3G7U7W7_9PSED|nr:Acyl-CoA dehydrogenase/oxidase domain protein [Pseudomonas synxantha]EFQ63117.1 hypothetical protein PFWH6_2794 [Pseudomonas fluorescens WH6]
MAALFWRCVSQDYFVWSTHDFSPIDFPDSCVNDAQVVTQHAFMGDITYQNAGAMFFGK